MSKPHLNMEPALLFLNRRIMDRIHEGGSIWYDKDRYEAYSLIAKISSEYRTMRIKEGTLLKYE